MQIIVRYDTGAGWYWNDAELHGGFDDAVFTGPFPTEAAMLADAREIDAGAEIGMYDLDLMRERRKAFEDAVRRKEHPRYVPCSGQGRGKRSWSVADELRAWWRPDDSRGRIRKFESADAATRLANLLNSEGGYPPIAEGKLR